MPTPLVNKDRLWESLMFMAQAGATPDGGVCRLALSEEDRQARDILRGWLSALGLQVQVDQVGNMLAIRSGELDLPPVMLGSHLDTVSSGGKFDGAAGVLAGLEVLRTLAENRIHTRHPVGLVMFTNEEGARYTTDLMGSQAFTGELTAEKVWSIRGGDESLVADELQRIGYKGDLHCGTIHPHAYLELHVEQGSQLQASARQIGVVEAITGITWLEVRVLGSANHAGTTPMDRRKDAGLAGARMVNKLPDLVVDIAGLRATCGCFTLLPGMVNVIAREALFTVDLRHSHPEKLEEAETRFGIIFREIAHASGVEVVINTLGHVSPQACDPKVVGLLEDTCRELGYSFQRMMSGAGHDAQAMARLCPTAMVFVPSRDGVSHSPEEYSSPEDLARGANVLLHAALHLADKE